MKESINQNHARKPDGSIFSCWQACCKFNPGYHRIFSSSLESDATKFGVGITLYFKFIKHLIYFFLIAVMLSVPALCFYIACFSSYNSANNRLSYLDLFTAATLGSAGLGSSSCGVARYPGSSSATATQTVMNFNCKAGTIADVSNIVYGLVSLGSTCRVVEDVFLALF